MKIEFALLADAAQAVGGKVFVLGGGWNLFRSASYPAPVQFAVAIGLGFSTNEVGMKYPLNIAIADESGVPIVPEMKGQVETGQPAPDVPKTASVKIPGRDQHQYVAAASGHIRDRRDRRHLDGSTVVRGNLRGSKSGVRARGRPARTRQLNGIARLLPRGPNGRYSRDATASIALT